MNISGSRGYAALTDPGRATRTGGVVRSLNEEILTNAASAIVELLEKNFFLMLR
jgi:hypothetical protein